MFFITRVILQSVTKIVSLLCFLGTVCVCMCACAFACACACACVCMGVHVCAGASVCVHTPKYVCNLA